MTSWNMKSYFLQVTLFTPRRLFLPQSVLCTRLTTELYFGEKADCTGVGLWHAIWFWGPCRSYKFVKILNFMFWPVKKEYGNVGFVRFKGAAVKLSFVTVLVQPIVFCWITHDVPQNKYQIRQVVMNKLYLPSDNLSELYHICTEINYVSPARKVSVEQIWM